MGRFRYSVSRQLASLAILTIGFASLRYASTTWAGAALLATLFILSVALLAVIYLGGRRRAFWLGFVLLGWGYMALAGGAWWSPGAGRPDLVTTHLLDRLYPLLAVPNPLDKPILAALEKPVQMPFANATPLGMILQYVQTETSSPTLTSGIPMLVQADEGPDGPVERTPVTLNLIGVPLRTSLRAVLQKVGLAYSLQDGMLLITSSQKARDLTESFQRAGHCYFALLFGFLGGLAGQALQVRGARPPGGQGAMDQTP